MTALNNKTILTEDLYSEAKKSKTPPSFLGLVTEEGDSLLHLAVAKNDAIFTRKLFKWKVKANILNTKTQETPLHAAAKKGHVRMISILWNHNPDINAQNKEMDTPLHCAIWGHNEEVAEELIGLGAKLDIVNDSGLTPLQACYEIRYLGNTSDLLERRSGGGNLWKHTLSRVTVILSMFLQKENEKTPFCISKDLPEFKFDGAHPTLIIDAFLSALTEAKRDIPLSNELIEFFESTQRLTNTDLLERYRHNQPILLHSGYETHLVSILLWGDCLAVCNRGKGAKKPIELYCFSQDKLNTKAIDRLTSDYNNNDAYEAAKTTTLNDLECESLSEKESSCDLPLQTTGNCVFASLEAAVYAFYRIYALKNRGPIETHNDSFKRFANQLRIHAVEKNVQYHKTTRERKLLLVEKLPTDLKSPNENELNKLEKIRDSILTS